MYSFASNLGNRKVHTTSTPSLNSSNHRNPALQTNKKYTNPALYNLIACPAHFNKTKFALESKPIMNSIVEGSGNLIYLTASNTWDLPNIGGLISHSIHVESKCNFFEKTILDLFSDAQKQGILKDIPKLRWIRQIYAAVHDIGKAYKGFEALDAPNGKQLPTKAKQVELTATQITLFKNLFARDLSFTTKFDKFLQDNPDCLHQENKDKFKDNLEALHQECKDEINTKLDELSFTKPQEVNLFKLLNIFLEDTVGEKVVAYVISKNDDERKAVIQKFRDSIDTQYEEAKKAYPQLSKQQFTFLKVSTFMSDISSYNNINIIYFDKNEYPLPNFFRLLELFTNKEDLASLKDLPVATADIKESKDGNVIPKVAFRGLWDSIGSANWLSSIPYAQGILNGLSSFTDVSPLNAEINAHINNFDTSKASDIYQGDNRVSDIVESQARTYKLAMSTQDVKAIMSHMVSKDIFTNLVNLSGAKAQAKVA
ncbi:MAG: hypothetical protein RLZZ210_1492 [Pseudomonadota bacterium]|jgi:hypothetical protein